MKPTIVSMIPINGEWIKQEDIPREIVGKIVEKTVRRAALNIGFEVVLKNDKSA